MISSSSASSANPIKMSSSAPDARIECRPTPPEGATLRKAAGASPRDPSCDVQRPRRTASPSDRGFREPSTTVGADCDGGPHVWLPSPRARVPATLPASEPLPSPASAPYHTSSFPASLKRPLPLPGNAPSLFTVLRRRACRLRPRTPPARDTPCTPPAVAPATEPASSAADPERAVSSPAPVPPTECDDPNDSADDRCLASRPPTAAGSTLAADVTFRARRNSSRRVDRANCRCRSPRNGLASSDAINERRRPKLVGAGVGRERDWLPTRPHDSSSRSVTRAADASRTVARKYLQPGGSTPPWALALPVTPMSLQLSINRNESESARAPSLAVAFPVAFRARSAVSDTVTKRDRRPRRSVFTPIASQRAVLAGIDNTESRNKQTGDAASNVISR
eukprot:Opistho-2@13119